MTGALILQLCYRVFLSQIISFSCASVSVLHLTFIPNDLNTELYKLFPVPNEVPSEVSLSATRREKIHKTFRRRILYIHMDSKVAIYRLGEDSFQTW